MRQTRNKKKVFKRKTKRRQSWVQSGGVQEQCAVCKKYFHKRGTIGSRDELYEDHIKSHPECKYCKTKHLDVNSLIKHIELEHPDKYKVAQNVKDDILKERNLIDELRNRESAIVGITPEFNTFYNKIEEAIKKAEVVSNEKERKQKEKERERKQKEKEQKEKEKEKEQKEKEKEQKEKEQKEKEQKEKERKMAISEEQERLRKEAEKRKQEEAERKKQEEAKRKKLAQKEKKEKKEAKRSQKISEQELIAMEAEESLSNQLRDAVTVDEVINIIENLSASENLSTSASASENLSTSASEFIPQKPLSILNILNQKDFEYLSITNLAIYNLYPAMNGYTEKVNRNIAYMSVSYFIIFLVGVINFRLRQKKLDLKLILKGGKASQMIMSEYRLQASQMIMSEYRPQASSISTDDVDILLVQNGIYDYGFLLQFATDFANYVNYFFRYQLSVLVPTNPRLTNKNIVKISFVDAGRFIPLSDIDIKPVESEYLQGENIITSEKVWHVYSGKKKVYTYNLLFYHQTLDAFIAEKKHYLQIYDNTIQKKNETEDCHCDKTHDYECSQICDYRNKMLEKFRKYIEPLERLQQENNKK